MENLELLAAVNTMLLAPIYFILNTIKQAIQELRKEQSINAIKIAKLEVKIQ